ncbi:hypothetical protein MCO_00408 [Bartonella sp. DB5-6]|nr:hypothetical protein MCO_00408 [Bartonella sp. DB5-6]
MIIEKLPYCFTEEIHLTLKMRTQWREFPLSSSKWSRIHKHYEFL